MNDTGTNPDSTKIPEVIRTYQDAHDGHDIPTALSAFAPQATVTDEGHMYRGTDEIQDWLAKTTTEYQYSRTLLGAKAIDHDTWLIRNRLEGNFPGSVVDLRYRFTLTGGLIAGLEIAP